MPKRVTRKNKLKKGGYYGYAGQLATGAPNWSSATEMAPPSVGNRGGNTMYGMGRRRGKNGKKVKKTGRRTKKVRRGGGSKFGGVSASFGGEGERGMANFGGVSVNKPGFAKEGDFNNFGAQPGSGHGSFITTSK